jgi:hypothetical protein
MSAIAVCRPGSQIGCWECGICVLPGVTKDVSDRASSQFRYKSACSTHDIALPFVMIASGGLGREVTVQLAPDNALANLRNRPQRRFHAFASNLGSYSLTLSTLPSDVPELVVPTASSASHTPPPPGCPSATCSSPSSASCRSARPRGRACGGRRRGSASSRRSCRRPWARGSAR